jgi:hypothetical protein
MGVIQITRCERSQTRRSRTNEAVTHHHGRPFPEADCPLLRPRQTGEPVRVDHDWFVRRDGTFVPVVYSSAPVTQVDDRSSLAQRCHDPSG